MSIIDQFTPLPLIDRDLNGKVIVITGANTGLGFEAAKHLATMNPAKIILAVRNVKKGNLAKDAIQQATNFQNLEVYELDLSSFASVKSFVDKIEKSEQRLDILISNAAVANSVWNLTKDGWEESIQTNHLSNMLLLILLVPLLRKTAKQFGIEPRIVVVASEVHSWSKFAEGKESETLNLLNNASKAKMNERYPTTKIMNILMTKKFARVFPDLTIHVLNPGLCITELARDLNAIKSMIFNFMRNRLGRTSEMGSRTLVHAAIYEGWNAHNIPNARYFSNCKEFAPSIEARNIDYQEKLWTESEQVLRKVDPRITNIISNKY